MEWLTAIRKCINFMEDNLTNDITAQEISEQVYLSPFFLQKGFSIMTGFGLMEYLRNRRLYKAALDLRNTKDKVIDIALRYCYETPESFTKAFTRFHGSTPVQVRAGAPIKAFFPLKISITISGGSQMDFKIITKVPFKVIGFEKEFSTEDCYEQIPKFWDEIFRKYANNVYAGKVPANSYEKAVIDNNIGEYGICIDDIGANKFRYLIAGKYTGGDVPAGMSVYEFNQTDWAVFDCIGAIPETLQDLNTRIFKEWLPGNPDYELAGNANVEWYDMTNSNMESPDYHSAIWIPIKKIIKSCYY